MAGSPPVEVLEAAGVRGRVRTEFQAADNRYSHEIWSIRGNDKVLMLKADVNQAMPGAACFTQVHRQDETVLLTGSTGPCHWSMGVQIGEVRFAESLDPEVLSQFEQRYGLNAPRKKGHRTLCHFLYFDVACRIQQAVPSVRCEYMLAEGVVYRVRNAGNTGVIMNPAMMMAGILQVVANPFSNELEIFPNPCCRISHSSHMNLRFYAPEMAIEAYPATMRWSYGFWVI